MDQRDALATASHGWRRSGSISFQLLGAHATTTAVTSNVLALETSTFTELPLVSAPPTDADAHKHYVRIRPAVDPGLEPLDVSVTEWKAAHPGWELCTGAVVVKNLHALILQRAPGDFNPLRWEYPGGRAEDGETIPEAVARELWEETKLEAVRLVRLLHVHDLEEVNPKTGRFERWRKLSFLVEVAGADDDDDNDGQSLREKVALHAKEHCAQVWVNEDGLLADRFGGFDLSWTYGGVQKTALLDLLKVLKAMSLRM